LNAHSLIPRTQFLAGFLLLAFLVGTFPGAIQQVLAAPGDTTRVSVDSSGAQADDGSNKPAISDDGRFVAFQSSATNLVSGDTNNFDDIFVHDRQTGATTRVSVDSSGTEGNGGSGAPSISADGRYVAFYSDASNLVSGDTNDCGDTFVHDRQAGTTTRVSVDSNGVEQNAPPSDDYGVVSISGDGRFVAFYSDATNLVSGDTNNESDIFVHDLQTGQTTRASLASDGAQANGGSSYPTLSTDGRTIAFQSYATNLVAGDTNGQGDVFVRDLQTGTTTRVSINSSGVEANGWSNSPSISGDGRYVLFLSRSSNLDPRAFDFGIYELAYVHDRQNGLTSVVSVYSSGDVLGVGSIDMPNISRDGRHVAYEFREHGSPEQNTNVYDLLTGDTVPVTEYGAGDSWPWLSGNGSLVAFSSLNSTMVIGDTNGQPDIFVSEISYGPESNPTVASFTPDCELYLCPRPTPTNITFVVIFSEQVSGVTLDDFTLTLPDGVSGAAITGISGYGNQYLLSVDTGTGDGELRLKLVDDDSILDSALNPLGGPGAGNGNKSSSSYYVDKSTPTVTSITRADPSPTSAESVRFTVNFSEEVWPVVPEDFVLTTTGSLTGASVMAIDPSRDEYNSVATYTVTVSTGTGDGTLRLDLIDDDSIHDQTDNPLGGTGTGNGDFTSGEVYTIVKDAPSVTGILRADPSPTGADTVHFNVIFSEPVSGVDTSDFALSATGGLSGMAVSSVSGSGEIYTVTASTGSGEGSLRLDLLDDDSITDAEANPLGTAGTGNGDFTSGESYTIDRAAPAVTGILRADPNPTTAPSVAFSVVFSEPATGVDTSDFALAVTGTLTGAAVTTVSGSGTSFSVSVSTGSGDGSLRLDLIDNDSITDASGFPLGGTGPGNGSYTTGESYTVNRTPRKTFTTTLRSNGRNDGWVLESGEDTSVGGSLGTNAPYIYLGDSSQDRQYRAILHFPTYYLPDNAVVTLAILMVKGYGVVGSDPFATHGDILVDIRYGPFSNSIFFWFNGLEIADFQSPAHMDAAGVIQNNPINNWYWTMLDPSAFPYINLYGVTQFKLRFAIDDDDNQRDDLLVVYSGDYNVLPDRPRLLVEYYLGR
jgi:Tol biopolymer transport system component